MKKKISLFLLLFFLLRVTAQNSFNIIKDKKTEKITFKFINNIIIIPVELNGKKLNFILDTGVKQSLLFNVGSKKMIELNEVKRVTIRGLGSVKYFDALQSKNNLLRINDVYCSDFNILVILNEEFDFSARMGLDIHGIIGSELFTDFIVKINYARKKITVTKPAYYKYKKCKNCHEFPLIFHHNKPYINVKISGKDKVKIPVKLLLDTGSGESLWLFKNSSSKISIPKKNFKAFLGKGLSGDINGNKSKLKSLEIGVFKFENLIVSYPDSLSVFDKKLVFNRNGILGAEILKRFHAIYDYPNKKVTFKKNNKYFKNKFTYNKSGLDIIHNGKMLIQEKKSFINFNEDSYQNVAKEYSTFSYAFKKSFRVSFVKENSPALKAGIKKDDIILELNGLPIYTYTLANIMYKLSGKGNKKITLLIKRNGLRIKYKIKLKELL